MLFKITLEIVVDGKKEAERVAQEAADMIFMADLAPTAGITTVQPISYKQSLEQFDWAPDDYCQEHGNNPATGSQIPCDHCGGRVNPWQVKVVPDEPVLCGDDCRNCENGVLPEKPAAIGASSDDKE